MERYVCIHGHFYQPPRENPWSGLVERQESAYPYHDWNQRITEECYAANTDSPILDEEGRVRERRNNYAYISFNFGPTLLSWMERHAPHTLHLIVEADRHSQQRFGGHGSAMAQIYSHQIQPLANARDKRTQVIWGVRDFVHRFGRQPEGMWLPETAVDLDSLEILAEQGLRFTVLSPYQAQWVREIGAPQWRPTGVGGIDPTRAYSVTLPSGRELAVFFYHGMVSSAVAFEGLLHDGGRFARRLLGSFDDGRDEAQLMHIATDGESYGHHHRHGDMALAYATDYIERSGQARLTNYGEFLARCPPTHQVVLLENTAWSCAHGLGRWRENCGCHAGSHPRWNQAWRAELRETLNWLRDELADRFERAAATVLHDPWAARDEYVDVVLDRSPASVDRFLARHAPRATGADPRQRALALLELQRNAMLMYTSCGWFWDDPSGWETVQILRYAARAVQLGRELSGEDLEPAFQERLARVKSNLPEEGNGARIFDTHIKPAMSAAREGDKMKVLLLTNEYPPYTYGGAGVHVEFLSQELARLMDVEVRSFGDQRIETDRLRVRGYEVDKATFTAPSHLRPVFEAMARDVAFGGTNVDADVVHCHTWYTHLGGILIKLAYGIPLVITVHSLEPLRPWKREQLGGGYEASSWVERTALGMADAIVGVSSETRADVLRLFDVDPTKVHVIYNGIDPTLYRPVAATDALDHYGVDKNRPYVLFVGRITRQKGIIHLVRAIPEIDPRAQVVLCAGAPDTPEIGEEMEQAVATVQAERDGVIWVREMVPRDAVMQIYTHAQVFCCPSIYEPFGLINLEAMACETAVVASAVGGIPEVVVDGETGYLVPVEQQTVAPFEPVDPARFSHDLATAVNLVLADPGLAERMGKAGRRRVEEHFSWSAVARQTQELYGSLVLTGAPR